MKKNMSSKAGQRLLTLSCRWLWASVCRYRLARQECSSSATANTPLCKYFQHGYEPYDSDRAFQQRFYRCNHKWLVSWKKEPVICYFFTVCRALKPVCLLASCKSELGPSVSICERGNKGLFVSLNHSCSWKQTLSKKKKTLFFQGNTLNQHPGYKFAKCNTGLIVCGVDVGCIRIDPELLALLLHTVLLAPSSPRTVFFFLTQTRENCKRWVSWSLKPFRPYNESIWNTL